MLCAYLRIMVPMVVALQHGGKEPAHFPVHYSRLYQENMGFLMIQHGEDAGYLRDD